MTALSPYYCYYPSPIGKLLLLAEKEKLISVDFEQEQFEPNPSWILKPDLALFQQVAAAFDCYFAGEIEHFEHIPLAPKGTPFQQKIWHALRQIPYGKTASYGELAHLIDNPKAVRAVGGAVGSNPISIIIPCHRILGKNATLTGFGGGLPAKRFLLQLEKIPFVDKGIEYVKPRFFKKYHL